MREVYSAFNMEQFTGIISYRPNVLMTAEIFVWLLIFLIILKIAGRNRYFRPAFFGMLIFIAYIHRILLPFIVSGAYIFLIAGIMCAVAELRLSGLFTPVQLFADSLLYYTDREKRSRAELLMLFAMTAIVLIQLSRINIAMDYDSLRYGLRSEYVLTGGEGISGFFKNHGYVNMVYAYPKGYELLTLPLNFGHTYGYVLCVNIWMLVFVMACVGGIAEALTGSKRAGLWAAAMSSLMPGISNMAVTAKTDLITVLLQLLFIYSVVRYIRENDAKYTGIGLSAIILSYTMKPTAYIFSTIIGLAALVFLIRSRKPLCFNGYGIRLIAMAAAYFGIIMLRTYMVSGLPVAGVFTELLEKMGFELKYPLASVGMPQGKVEGLVPNLINMLVRAVLFVFLPVGEDMDHVRMAWGGLIFATLLIYLIVCRRSFRRQLCRRPQYAYVFMSFYTVLGLSALTLFLLYQVDGNYYMLLYTLTAVAAASLYYENAVATEKKQGAGIAARLCFGAAAILMLLVTAFSGWAGAVGFTPADIKNRGYYNHEIEYGWTNPVSLTPEDRVIAFAAEPDCYKLMAGVESFVDIDGSGGNVLLTDTKLNIFKEYCSFADIDYIYVDRDWLNDETNQRHVRAKVLFTYMLEDGDFSEIIVADPEGKELYFRVDKERMSVPWETEMSPELKERIEEQSIIFKELIG